MRRLRAFLLRCAGLFGKARRDRDLADEFSSNLDLHVQDNLRAGMGAAEARRNALLKFGSVEAAKDNYRDRRSLPWIEAAAKDLRYALRPLRRNPGFAIVAIATLSLGIGANTAMFTVAQAVLFRSLPYAQPDRLILITETNPLKHWTNAPASPANFADWKRLNTVFSDMAAFQGADNEGASHFRRFLTGDGEPQPLKAVAGTGNMLEILGVKPLLGRTLTWEETFDGKDRNVVLSFSAWQTVFGGDPKIVGRKINLNGKTHDVVGVMPRDFYFPGRDTQVYLSAGFSPNDFVTQRRPHGLTVIARLRPGISVDQAREQMTSIASRLEKMYPENNTKMGVRLDLYHDTLAAEKRPALVMLLCAVGVLLLIVCSNVANLQLGRAIARLREISIRQALGAGRGRLIQQLLTESLVLSVLGGLIGLAFAVGARTALVRLAPEAVPQFADARIDFWVIAFNMALTFCAPLLFGVVPALTASRSETLRDRDVTATRSSRRLRDLLVAAEVAFSVILVAGAGLLIHSLVMLESVNPGFNPEQALSFNLILPGARYATSDRILRAVNDIEGRLRSLPGVKAVGLTLGLALTKSYFTGDATPEGRPAGEYERELRYDGVTPDLFRAMGTPLIQGRFLNQFDDLPKSPDVTLANEALAKAYFPGQNPIGKRIKFGRPADKDATWATIVGIVGDIKEDELGDRVRPQVYVPLSQLGAAGGLGATFVIRAAGDPDAVAAGLRREIRGFDQDLAVTDLTTLQDLVHNSTGNQRFRTSLLSGFAGVALLLAALGVYGVLAYSVAQRSREIGLRQALGASCGNLFGMVLRDGMRPVLFGSVVGLGGAYAATRLIKNLLFGIAPADPTAYLSTVAILGTVALCACAIPAFRAVQTDPLVCLREQ